MHETKMSVSAKGKSREDAHWQLGWWDLHALMESPTRPIAWSKSSVIFTPDSTQPMVLARHFPSSRQFVLPSPAPWANTLGSYEPPTIITISPTDDWLFAYFPGNGGDGAGCLWRKNGQLDNWALQEWWTFAKGAGAVAAEWICTDREWVLSEQDQPYRLPPRGPFLHTNVPTLVLVTQAHQAHVCLLPSPLMTFKILKASLLHVSTSIDGQTNQQGEFPTSSRGGQRVCAKAAIGINYNDNVIMIATRSHLLPPHITEHIPFNTMDLGLHLDMTEPTYQTDSLIATEWEQWGEEPTIELSTLQIRYSTFNLAIRVYPAATIRRPASQVIDLRFCAIPPDIVPPSPTITRDPRRPVKDSNTEKGTMYLLASFLHFDDYTSLPKSEITTFPLTRGKLAEITPIPKGERTRAFDTGTLAFLAPSPSPKRIVVGFPDSNGTVRRQSKTKETSIGNMIVINPGDLTTDDQWDTAHILSPCSVVGRDVPLNAAVSPNHALICTISPSTTLAARTVVHALPRWKHGLIPRDDMARAIVLSILSRTSPSDVIHALTVPATPLDDVLKTLYNSLRILENHAFGMQEIWIEEVLGIATEVYLSRAQRAELKAEKRALEEWGLTAHELTSVVALNAAFEDCREGGAYDLEAVWQLVGLSLWFIELLEKILRQCVYMGSEMSSAPSEEKPRQDAGEPSVGVSVLLHLLHPYAAGNLHVALQHIKRLHDDLKSLSPKTENAQMAKDVFMDGLEGSGIYLDALEPLLKEIHRESQKTAAEVLKKGLVNCTLTPALQQHAKPMVEKVLALGVMDRVRLFIKPADLIDGMSKLAVGEKVKQDDSDVVSKGVLLHAGGIIVQCVRCGGRSEIGGPDSVAGHVSQRWNAWERVLSTRCVCGGAWVRSL